MPGNAPTIMVSSTFYDLRQIRADLAHFIEDELGYRPLLSEFRSFPIDPDADTIENCRRRVERDADILVLIIGGRYGYVDSESDKSVTNLEYLAARAKGIPIYAFVDRSVVAVLPTWRSNPNADFSGSVENVRVFEFIDQVRSTDRVWTQEFDRAQDIVTGLRAQFAYLLLEGLQWRMRLREQPSAALNYLHGRALRLALERPHAWEYRLFGQALSDEVQANANLRREHRLGVAFGAGEHVQSNEIPLWIQRQTNELSNLAGSLDTLINVALPQAFRPDGVPGDVAEIVFVAEQIGAGYRHALEWSQRVRRTYVEEEYRQLLQEMSLWTDNIIETIETYGPDLLRQIDEGLQAVASGATGLVLEAPLVLEAANMDRYEEEFERVFGTL